MTTRLAGNSRPSTWAIACRTGWIGALAMLWFVLTSFAGPAPRADAQIFETTTTVVPPSTTTTTRPRTTTSTTAATSSTTTTTRPRTTTSGSSTSSVFTPPSTIAPQPNVVVEEEPPPAIGGTAQISPIFPILSGLGLLIAGGIMGTRYVQTRLPGEPLIPPALKPERIVRPVVRRVRPLRVRPLRVRPLRGRRGGADDGDPDDESDRQS